nr:GP16 [Calliteara abietis nucleopolyhedrovirus]
MNYSAILLVLLTVYLWHSGSFSQELRSIKKLLMATYDLIESNFNYVSLELSHIKDETQRILQHLQNGTKHTIDLITSNANKIDKLNDKIDFIVQKY